jgi:hypothetical protein
LTRRMVGIERLAYSLDHSKEDDYAESETTTF